MYLCLLIGNAYTHLYHYNLKKCAFQLSCLTVTAQQVYMTESPPPYSGIEPTAPPPPMNGHPQGAGKKRFMILFSSSRGDYQNKTVKSLSDIYKLLNFR